MEIMENCKWLATKKMFVNFQKKRVYLFGIVIFTMPLFCLLYKDNITFSFILISVIITILAVINEIFVLRSYFIAKRGYKELENVFTNRNFSKEECEEIDRAMTNFDSAAEPMNGGSKYRMITDSLVITRHGQQFFGYDIARL